MQLVVYKSSMFKKKQCHLESTLLILLNQQDNIITTRGKIICNSETYNFGNCHLKILNYEIATQTH
jgi:hypothetical protein